jgi:uncharacterized membrane protein YphA (DoxX/SURF4 family)
MNQKSEEARGALRIIKFTQIAGIVIAVFLLVGAIWVWSSAMTAEATGHEYVFPASSIRDISLAAAGIILLTAGISLWSVDRAAKALQGVSTDKTRE